MVKHLFLIFFLCFIHPLKADPPKTDPPKTTEKIEIPRSLYLETETALMKTPHLLRIGLFDMSLKTNDRLTLKMWNTPMLLGLYNIGFQVNLYQYQNFYFNLDFHYATINLNRFAQDPAQKEIEKRIHIVPVYLNAGWHFSKNWYLGLSLRSYTIEGNLNTGNQSDSPFGTVIASSNKQVKVQLGYALNEAWSFWFFINQIVSQNYNGSIYLKKEIDTGIEVEAYGKAKTQIEKNAKSFGFRVVRKGELIDFQIGFDRGQPPLYVTGLLLPNQQNYTLPYIDFAVKF